LGCGALKRLDQGHGELKSMRTADAHLRKGVARALLRHIESAARAEGMGRLSLETGSTAPFTAALRLYASEGFVECGPFGDYVLDPFSIFMTKLLGEEPRAK
jgi:putative acetyltransferase